jgi:multidrug efflux pump
VVSLLIVVLGLRCVVRPAGQPVPARPRTAWSRSAPPTTAPTRPRWRASSRSRWKRPIAQAQGIDYLSSSSSGVSTITATLRLNYDSNRALTEINTQVNSVRNQLPPQAQQPVLTVQTGQTTDAMYIGFYSDTLPTNNVTDFLVRVVQAQARCHRGRADRRAPGRAQFALRAWLDAQKMAAYGVTATDVSAALAANNYLADWAPPRARW